MRSHLSASLCQEPPGVRKSGVQFRGAGQQLDCRCHFKFIYMNLAIDCAKIEFKRSGVLGREFPCTGFGLLARDEDVAHFVSQAVLQREEVI